MGFICVVTSFKQKNIKRSGIHLAERISMSFSFRESSGKDESGSMLFFLFRFCYKTCVFYFNISIKNHKLASVSTF